MHEDFVGDDQQDAAEAMRKLVERCVEADARIGGDGPPPLLLDAPADGNIGSDGVPLGILVGEEMHCQGCGRRWHAPTQALPLLPLHSVQWRGVGVEAALRDHFGVPFDLDEEFACAAADGGCGARGRCRGQ